MPAPGDNPVPSKTSRRRKPNHLVKLSRSPKLGRLQVVNHFNRTVDALAGVTHFPRASAFLPQHLWPWAWNYLKNAFTPRIRFPTYPKGSGTQNGVYSLTGAPLRLALAGDWGTGTDDAWDTAQQMLASSPDLTLHLGDVYYVGGQPEIEQNCLGQSMNSYDGVYWPHGRQGSFALNGNHEMYANGRPYFKTFLPTLGLKTQPGGQLASFFCLETEFWRILGLDTGYNSVGIPILSQIPVLNSIPSVGGDCHLEPGLIQWLKEVVRLPDPSKKATVLLSHHQYFTAFPNEQNYSKPARQLAPFFPGQEVLWLWGHEHRLALYERFSTSDGLTFFGRCIGHGGMPVELAEPDVNKAPVTFYDTRSHSLDDGSRVGENGFVVLTIEGKLLTLDYRDSHNNLLLVETFVPKPDGTLDFQIVKNPSVLQQVPRQQDTPAPVENP